MGVQTFRYNGREMGRDEYRIALGLDPKKAALKNVLSTKSVVNARKAEEATMTNIKAKKLLEEAGEDMKDYSDIIEPVIEVEMPGKYTGAKHPSEMDFFERKRVLKELGYKLDKSISSQEAYELLVQEK